MVEEANVFSGEKGNHKSGFVDMSTEEEAWKAMDLLDGYYLKARRIEVNQARPVAAIGP